MATNQSSSATSDTSDDWIDPRVDVTINAVDWDTLMDIACKQFGVQEAQWGIQKSGGYNLVRFLHLDDDENTTIVVRVPLHPEEGATRERMQAYCNRIASEVATMQYVEAHTSIPVPHVIHYSAEEDEDGVRSPYIMMSKVDGVSLCSVWDDMPDEQRDVVLQQVVDIYLELASHRFDKIGALFRDEGESEGKDAWYIKPLSFLMDPDESRCAREASETVHSSGTDYWIAYANANLRSVSERAFGSQSKQYGIAIAWFLRSLVPSLYDPSLDTSGFPLMPGDFHSQNIRITNVDSSPRISAVIDWERSATVCTSTFAQYPFFIVDHPAWPDDHSLRPRNVRDQAAFNRYMLEAERKKYPADDQPLSRAFANCLGVYLFEQCVTSQIMFSALYSQIIAYVFGDDEIEMRYYNSLLENGVLRKEREQVDEEVEVRLEAESILGDEISSQQHFTKSEFIAFAREHKNRFPKEGKVCRWLSSVE